MTREQLISLAIRKLNKAKYYLSEARKEVIDEIEEVAISMAIIDINIHIKELTKLVQKRVSLKGGSK